MADTISLLAHKAGNEKNVCLAEEYDKRHNEASIVAKANGQRPYAEKISGNEEISGKVQALVALRPRYLYIKGHLRGGNKVFIRIYRVIRFRMQQGVPIVEVRMFNKFSRGKWLIPLFDWLKPMVEALKDKLLNPENVTVYARFPEDEKRRKRKKAYQKPPVQ